MKNTGRCSLSGAILAAIAVIFILIIFGKSVRAEASSPIKNETVIVLHGLARTDKSMTTLAKELEKVGYKVNNVRYPSTRLSIPELVEKHLVPAVRKADQKGGKIHFVTHSMGGILVRQYLASHPEANIGRIVMLAPPNRGSEIIDTMADSAILCWLLGPAGRQLSTSSNSLPNTLPPIGNEVGIIAGTRSVNPILSKVVAGDDDGKVSVNSTALAEMQDHLVFPVNHTFIMKNSLVIEQVRHFLEFGYFQRS